MIRCAYCLSLIKRWSVNRKGEGVLIWFTHCKGRQEVEAELILPPIEEDATEAAPSRS